MSRRHRRRLTTSAVAGKAIDEADMDRLWPGIVIKIEESEGTGQWKGLKLISVSAGKTVGNKNVAVQLSRYVSTTDIVISKAGDMPVLQER